MRINLTGRIWILATAILIIVILVFKDTLTNKDKEYYEREIKLQERIDSLESELGRAERSLMVYVLRLDSAVLYNKGVSDSVDSLQQVIKDYQNPYVNKTDKELGDLMNKRAWKRGN